MYKNLREEILARIRAECDAQIQACRKAIQAHRSLVEEMSAKCLLPGEAARMLTHLSENPLSDPSPDRLQAHAEILSGLRAVAQNPSVSFEAARAVNRLYLEAEPAVTALALAAAQSLENQVAELIEVERVFLAGYGFPHEATAISRLAVSLTAGINSDAFTSGKQTIRNHPTSETAPRLSLGTLTALLEGQE
jgi:hypothetical protein